jgi:hypothetical protein
MSHATRANSWNKVKKQGPQLPIVQAALIGGERHRDERHSGYYIDKQDLTNVDHYALCLYRLRKANTDHRNGVFRNASMSVIRDGIPSLVRYVTSVI